MSRRWGIRVYGWCCSSVSTDSRSAPAAKAAAAWTRLQSLKVLKAAGSNTLHAACHLWSAVERGHEHGYVRRTTVGEEKRWQSTVGLPEETHPLLRSRWVCSRALCRSRCSRCARHLHDAALWRPPLPAGWPEPSSMLGVLTEPLPVGGPGGSSVLRVSATLPKVLSWPLSGGPPCWAAERMLADSASSAWPCEGLLASALAKESVSARPRPVSFACDVLVGATACMLCQATHARSSSASRISRSGLPEEHDARHWCLHEQHHVWQRPASLLSQGGMLHGYREAQVLRCWADA